MRQVDLNEPAPVFGKPLRLLAEPAVVAPKRVAPGVMKGADGKLFTDAPTSTYDKPLFTTIELASLGAHKIAPPPSHWVDAARYYLTDIEPVVGGAAGVRECWQRARDNDKPARRAYSVPKFF